MLFPSCLLVALLSVQGDRALARRRLVSMALQTTTLGTGAVAAALWAAQAQRWSAAVELEVDPLALQLRSANELAESRRTLESQWSALRQHPASRLETSDALRRVLKVRHMLTDAEALVRESRMRDLNAALPQELVGELESAATVLASSSVLSRETRAAIGWQWGACGWRQCGAQADAAQALCKLRANLGMLVPIEALFYIDIAKRALDEVLQLGVLENLLPASELPEAEYLPAETLDMFLTRDDDEGGTEGQDYIEEYERTLLKEAGIM